MVGIQVWLPNGTDTRIQITFFSVLLAQALPFLAQEGGGVRFATLDPALGKQFVRRNHNVPSQNGLAEIGPFALNYANRKVKAAISLRRNSYSTLLDFDIEKPFVAVSGTQLIQVFFQNRRTVTRTLRPKTPKAPWSGFHFLEKLPRGKVFISLKRYFPNLSFFILNDPKKDRNVFVVRHLLDFTFDPRIPKPFLKIKFLQGNLIRLDLRLVKQFAYADFNFLLQFSAGKLIVAGKLDFTNSRLGPNFENQDHFVIGGTFGIDKYLHVVNGARCHEVGYRFVDGRSRERNPRLNLEVLKNEGIAQSFWAVQLDPDFRNGLSLGNRSLRPKKGKPRKQEQEWRQEAQ